MICIFCSLYVVSDVSSINLFANYFIFIFKGNCYRLSLLSCSSFDLYCILSYYYFAMIELIKIDGWMDKHDTINLHAQTFCTHKLHNQTHPKISQTLYKSKRNLVANDVQVSHTEFTIIIADNNPTHKHYMSEVLCPWEWLSNYVTLTLTINNWIQLTSFDSRTMNE